jgi:mannan endo-1,4-beta-mannosidase
MRNILFFVPWLALSLNLASCGNDDDNSKQDSSNNPDVVAIPDSTQGKDDPQPVVPDNPAEPTPRDTTISETAINSANPAVQTLYKFLYDNYGKKIISGSMANVSVEQSEAALVKAATGKTPMMQTFDFCFVTLTADRSTWEQNSVYQDISYYKNLWEQGGIVSACWHLNVPTQEAYAAKDEVNDQNKAWGAQVYFSAKNAVKDGTWENDFLNYSFDCAAEVLLKYKAEGIPVVWRPFHEGSGNATISGKDSDAWFWWGKDGAEAYKKLWVYMFDYFKAKGLDNLIWVWTTQIGVGSDGSENWYCKDDSNWYPGDQYVDIIARDNYNKAKASASITEFETIKQFWPNKMIALGENGGIANISDIFKNGGKYSYFMPWYTYNLKDLNKSDHAKLSWWQDAAKCDDVIFLEDIK